MEKDKRFLGHRGEKLLVCQPIFSATNPSGDEFLIAVESADAVVGAYLTREQAIIARDTLTDLLGDL